MTERRPLALGRLSASLRFVVIAATLGASTVMPCAANAADARSAEIFAAPPLSPLTLDPAPPRATTPSDRILLVSTRGLGTRCDAAAMAEGLRCERLVRDELGRSRWQDISWSDVLADFASPLPTVIYVHGNRVETSADKSHGLQFYRALAASKPAAAPMRYVIWSWPSSQIRGPVKDYEVKAARTKPVGWQLAWTVDQLPPEAPLTLVGYSYGARVVTGALHLLGGGRLNQLELADRAHTERAPLRAALVAAAVDAHWLHPDGYHGRALGQLETLLLVNNQLDPAMRFYPISPIGRHASALGYAGLGGVDANKIRSFDMTAAVGRHHALSEYLAASGAMRRVLEQIAVPTAHGEISVVRAASPTAPAAPAR